MQDNPFWRNPLFWVYGVLASLVASAIWALGGRLLRPIWDGLGMSAGFAEWLHDAGWLAFLITASLWFVSRRLPSPTKRSRGLMVYPVLQIHEANYGTGGIPGLDVTDVLRARVTNQQILEIRATNENMGGDPAKGQRKRLRVRYSVGSGESSVREVFEKETLKLP